MLVETLFNMNGFHRILTAIVITSCPMYSFAEDWPHWRGPNRNGHVAEESGWDGKEWSLDNEAWKTNVGTGSTSPLVIAERLYTVGWHDDQEHVQCLDAKTGKEMWRSSYAAPLYARYSLGDKGIYAGVCSTPEFDPETGFLFTLGIDGDLNCWDTRKRGEKVWGLNLYDQFKMPQRPRIGRSGHRDYGYTSSPLVQGEWLIVEVGGEAANLIALDKGTGKVAWRSEDRSLAGHTGGPAPIEVEGVPCVAVHNFEGLLVVRLDRDNEGKTVATYPWKTDFANNIAGVAVHRDTVLLTSAYNQYKIAKLQVSLKGASLLWEREEASKVCTPVIHDGHVYWAWRKLICLDFETGEVRWKGGRFGDPGSCIVTSDDRLIAFGGDGELVLAETAKRSPQQYTELAAKHKLFRTDGWPHVVLANGRLYCKDRKGNLVCFAL